MKIGLMLLMTLLCGTSCANTRGITVKTKVAADINSYKTAYADVEHDAYKDPKKRKHGPETGIIEGEINSVFRKLKIEPVYTEPKAQLKARCLIRHGWGTPRLTLHLHLKTKYITWVNIQLIDQKTKDVIGEADYQRPRTQTNSNDLIQQMFEAMLGKKIEEPQQTNTVAEVEAETTEIPKEK